MKKNPGDIIILHMCTTNYGHMMYSSWDMVCDRWTNRQTDKKSDIEVGAPPKNWNKCWTRHILFFSKINHIFKVTTTFIFENNKNMNKRQIGQISTLTKWYNEHLSFATVILCSKLQLWVGYFIYFELKTVFVFFSWRFFNSLKEI